MCTFEGACQTAWSACVQAYGKQCSDYLDCVNKCKPVNYGVCVTNCTNNPGIPPNFTDYQTCLCQQCPTRCSEFHTYNCL